MKEYMHNFDESKLRIAFAIKDAYARGDLTLTAANAKMRAEVKTLTATELAYIEQNFQAQVDDECVREDLQAMLAVYDGVLINSLSELPAGHPLRNYFDENVAIRQVIADIERLLTGKYIKNVWDETFEKLDAFKIHLSRKQNQLYSALEKRGFDRPTTTMWLFDNVIRDQISALCSRLQTGLADADVAGFALQFATFKEYILDLMNKEENILLPTALELLDADMFADMALGDAEIGYCLISPSSDAEFESDAESESDVADHSFATVNSRNVFAETTVNSHNANAFQADLEALLAKYNYGSNWTAQTKMNVKQGLLSLDQINLLFQHLPVDISYVDENDLVAFYNDSKHRVFPRSRGVIGRLVQNCHPADSVDMVQEIINKFRNGTEDKVDFWINKPGLFIYILYVAVRDANGQFRGVLEMMQDCTRIRSLEGSQRLLQFGAADSSKNSSRDGVTAESTSKSTSRESLATTSLSTNDEMITVLTPETKLIDVLNQYPTFKDFMIKKSPQFQMMNSPLFKIMVKVATIKMVSERSGLSLEQLQAEFAEFLDTLDGDRDGDRDGDIDYHLDADNC